MIRGQTVEGLNTPLKILFFDKGQPNRVECERADWLIYVAR